MDSTGNTAAEASELCSLLGIKSWELPPDFREMLVAIRFKGPKKPLLQLLSETMDAWQGLDKPHPPAAARAAARLREAQKSATPVIPAEEIRLLEEEEWQRA